MKIAFLSFYSSHIERGAEVFAADLAEKLANKYQVEIYHGDFNSPVKDSHSFLKYVYLDLKSLRIAWFTLKTLFKMLNNKSFDFIIPVNGGWETFLTKIYVLALGSKLVVSGQAGIGRDDKFNLYCNPDAFVALSERGLSWAKKINPAIKIVKIPNGVDLKKFNPEAKKISLKLERPIILCVAALEKYKRVDLTIKAVAKLDKGSLLLIGRGGKNQEDYIDNLGKSLLGAKRYFRLAVKHREMPSYYVMADLFTMVSESYEAFGTVYLEAMACGLPIVATDDKLRREIIAQAGIFVKNPKDINDYACCLERALKTDFKGIPRRQAEKFSWDKMASEYEKLFLELKK